MTLEDIQKLKKKELHCHLSGAIPLKTIADIIALNNTAIPSNFKYLDDLYLKKRVNGMDQYFRPWALLKKLSVGKEAINLMFLGALYNFKKENIDYVELRFSPKTVLNNNDVNIETGLKWLIESLQNAEEKTSVKCKLILTLDRYQYDIDFANRLFKALRISNKSNYIVGVDLAGDEKYSLPNGSNIFFRKCKNELGLGITIHAGETGNLQNVRDAVSEFEADRIGHGIALIDDLTLINLIIEKDVCVEICLQSNYIATNVSSIENHPIVKFIECKVPFVICADNPAIHCFSLSQEYELFLRITKREDILNKMYEIQKKYSFF